MNSLEWQAETQRLGEVKGVIRRQIDSMQDTMEHRKSEMRELREEFWDDTTLNTANKDDLIEMKASITQQSRLIQEQERSYSRAELAIRALRRLLPSPYFGRVDFTEPGEGEPYTIYIGVATITDETSNEPVVLDWRAPISQLFYDYTHGPAEYETPEGKQEVDIRLKRQYIIRGGRLENMLDTGVHVVDEMLQTMLTLSADDRMKSIVTTIQSEQNQVIRETRYPLVIVQGAAGSGKTSVALQRAAYLLYKYRNTLAADQMILFSPNSLFNDYVSNVLPELGENNMLQTTLPDVVADSLKAWNKETEDSYGQLESLLTADEGREYEVRLAGIEWKSSQDCARLIQAYIKMLKEQGMVFSSFRIEDRDILSGHRIRDYFYSQNTHLPVSRRLGKLKERIEGELEELQKAEERALYQELVTVPQYIGTDVELKQRSRKTMNKIFTGFRASVESLEFIDVESMYRRLFSDMELLDKLVRESGASKPVQWNAIASQTLEKLDRGVIAYEDGAAALYFMELLEGNRLYSGIRHVIVDEAQDYSPMHYELLHTMFPHSHMTLLGDLNQGIFPYSSGRNYEYVRELYGSSRTRTFVLHKSYRSTKEIVELSKRILPEAENVEAHSRSGEQPVVAQAASQEELTRLVASDIQRLQEQGARSIAVLCKTAKESLAAYDRLQPVVALKLITKDTRSFVSGVLLMPAYFAKGLEFDAVIIYNADEAIYEKENERKLFYTACTRALHHLHVYHTGRLTPFLKGNE